MIKHTGESKRKDEEIAQLRKQIETGEQTTSDMKATLYLLDQSKEAEKKAQDRIAEVEIQIDKLRSQLADAKFEANQAKSDAAVKIATFEAEIQRLQSDDKSKTSAAQMKFKEDQEKMLETVKKDLNAQLQKKAAELAEKQSVIEKLRQDLKEEQERREEEIEIIQLEKEAL